MKKSLMYFAWGGIAFLFFLSQQQLQSQNTADLSRKLDLLNAYPELIVVNGKIHTMDARLSQAQAMAVKNGRIVALGSNNEIRFLAGPKTEVLDAKNRTILPGLIDSHTHPHLWAVEHWLGGEGDFSAKKYNDPQLQIFYAHANDRAEVVRNLERIVRERAQLLGPGKWIWTSVAGGSSLPESRRIVYPLFAQVGNVPGTITREFLDTLAPNNPLLVYSTEAIGPEVHNTKAKEAMLRLLGIEESGLNARTAVTYDILFRGRTEDKIDFLKRELLECVVAQGITTFANHYYGSPSIMKIYRTMHERGELPVRWAWFVGTNWGNQLPGTPGSENAFGDNGDHKFLYRNLGDFRKIGNDYIWNAGVANEGWETGLTCTKAKPTSSIDASKVFRASDLRPDCSIPIDYEKQGGYWNVKAALESGLRIGFLHGYSDGTYDALFNMLDKAIREGKTTLDEVRSLRISMEHNPMIRPDQVAIMAKYNIMPGFNGYQVQGDIKGGAFLKLYGEQYMNWMAPMKSLVDAGVHPVFNTDAHLGKVKNFYSKDMDYPPQWDRNIWAFMEFFATRKMPHDGITYAEKEALDKVTLMKAATIWSAEQVLNEKNIGSLEVGKLADFIIIDRDYFSIPESEIHTIKTLLTAVGGKTVYRAPSY